MPKSSLISIKAAIGLFAMISYKKGANYAHIRDCVPGPHYTRKKDCRATTILRLCLRRVRALATVRLATEQQLHCYARTDRP
jgi:hypothetical protein